MCETDVRVKIIKGLVVGIEAINKIESLVSVYDAYKKIRFLISPTTEVPTDVSLGCQISFNMETRYWVVDSTTIKTHYRNIIGDVSIFNGRDPRPVPIILNSSVIGSGFIDAKNHCVTAYNKGHFYMLNLNNMTLNYRPLTDTIEFE